jgi:hypothetical protein
MECWCRCVAISSSPPPRSKPIGRPMLPAARQAKPHNDVSKKCHLHMLHRSTAVIAWRRWIPGACFYIIMLARPCCTHPPYPSQAGAG